jgi:hypothetical protein
MNIAHTDWGDKSDLVFGLTVQIFEQCIECVFRFNRDTFASIYLIGTGLELLAQKCRFYFVHPFLVRIHKTQRFPDHFAGIVVQAASTLALIRASSSGVSDTCMSASPHRHLIGSC